MRASLDRRGITRVEVLAVLLCAIFALVVVVLLTSSRLDRTGAKQMKMAMQIKQIHTGIVVFSRELDGAFPTPGQYGRKPPEDIGANTTAGLYALLLMQNYVTPELLISPFEASPRVRSDSDYDYDGYQPDADVYWDGSFSADLDTVSNVSFGHRPIDGLWRQGETFDARSAIVGSRGPASGIASRNSLSCLDGTWIGALCFNDNHVSQVHAGKPGTIIGGLFGWPDDNPFVYDEGDLAEDQVIAFTREMTVDGPVLQHD